MSVFWLTEKRNLAVLHKCGGRTLTVSRHLHLWKRSLSGNLNGLMHQVTRGWRGCVWACECCNVADVISAAEVIFSSLKMTLPNSVSELLVTSDLNNLPLDSHHCLCKTVKKSCTTFWISLVRLCSTAAKNLKKGVMPARNGFSYQESIKVARTLILQGPTSSKAPFKGILI